jgi:hypothetical protein
MSTRSARRAPIFLIAAICLAGGAARANSIVQSATHGPASTDWSYVFTFNQFNPAWGTLNDVIVTSQGTVSTQGTVTNHASAEESFSFQMTFQADLTLANGTTTQISIATPLSVVYNLASGASGSFGPYSGQAGNAVTTTYTSPAELSLYIGAGAISFPSYTLTGESLTGGGNIGWNLVTTAQDAVTVEYDYTPSSSAPEPFSLALSGTGLLLVTVLARKRALGPRR